MPTLSPHGGHCCGINHLHGMDYCSITDLDSRINEFEAGNRNNNRVLEIILSARQVEDANSTDGGRIHDSIRQAGGWGAVLAARGFRLTESWLNSNSGRNCYRFIKLNRFREDDNRSPLAPASFTGIRQAAVIPPAPVAPVQAGYRRAPGAHDVGDFVRNRTTGGTGIAVRFYRNIDHINMVVVRRPSGQENTWTRSNCDFFAPPVPAVEDVINNRREPAAPPRIVFSTFHNVFRDRGRSDAGWNTYEQARVAAPRGRQVDRRNILSDGSTVWVENVQQG